MKVRLKPYTQGHCRLAQRRFNSMKVRLKPYGSPQRAYCNKFQFHEGPIKTMIWPRSCPLSIRFNSMKVRLKPRCFVRRHHRISRFNSMKVRLKPSCCLAIHKLSTTFQFHEGPIKTADGWATKHRTLCFNSMKVRLKPIAFFSKIPLYTRGIIIQRYKNSSRKYVDVE